MANAIALIQKYLPELDKVYRWAAKTAVLDAPSAMVRETSEANVVKIAKMALQGLGEYSRNTGYVQGDATITWQTHTFSQDRGRKFLVDTMDDQETANISFGMLAGEFMREYVVRELDAYRMATYATLAGGTPTAADLTTGAAVLAAIDVATAAMDNAEVPEEGRLLFIENTQYSLLKQAATIERRIGQGNDRTFNRNFNTFDEMRVIKMPQSRFYSAITQYDGSTAGQEAGGYIKNASTGKDLNFMIVHPSAVMQITKHAVSKVISPQDNQTSDGYMYFYRRYHDAFVLDNKVNGIYRHIATT